MVGIAETTENSILALMFNATTWANVAVNATSSPMTSVGVALHTADPTETGNMTSNAANYGSYVRLDVSRSTSAFATPSGGQTNFAANVDFITSTGSGTTITHASVGAPASGAGTGTSIWFTGAISPTIAVPSSGVIPRLTTSSTFSID